MAAVFESGSRIKEVHIEGLVSETRPTFWIECRISLVGLLTPVSLPFLFCFVQIEFLMILLLSLF